MNIGMKKPNLSISEFILAMYLKTKQKPNTNRYLT